MKKELVCIECPNGCLLSVIVEGSKVIKVTGHTCDKGEAYAHAEIEQPVRVLTACVLTQGMKIRMLPVRTDKAIPKSKLVDAMKKIKKMRVKGRIRCGDIIVKDFIQPGINLIATRST